MTLSVICYPYHFLRAILSIHVQFCLMPFCPYTILSIPFCPYHFVRYHFVLEPMRDIMHSKANGTIVLVSNECMHRITCCSKSRFKGQAGRQCRNLLEFWNCVGMLGCLALNCLVFMAVVQ